jgi:hypothetical protein
MAYLDKGKNLPRTLLRTGYSSTLSIPQSEFVGFKAAPNRVEWLA